MSYEQSSGALAARAVPALLMGRCEIPGSGTTCVCPLSTKTKTHSASCTADSGQFRALDCDGLPQRVPTSWVLVPILLLCASALGLHTCLSQRLFMPPRVGCIGRVSSQLRDGLLLPVLGLRGPRIYIFIYLYMYKYIPYSSDFLKPETPLQTNVVGF
jgi:hypothetical protein